MRVVALMAIIVLTAFGCDFSGHVGAATSQPGPEQCQGLRAGILEISAQSVWKAPSFAKSSADNGQGLAIFKNLDAVRFVTSDNLIINVVHPKLVAINYDPLSKKIAEIKIYPMEDPGTQTEALKVVTDILQASRIEPKGVIKDRLLYWNSKKLNASNIAPSRLWGRMSLNSKNDVLEIGIHTAHPEKPDWYPMIDIRPVAAVVGDLIVVKSAVRGLSWKDRTDRVRPLLIEIADLARKTPNPAECPVEVLEWPRLFGLAHDYEITLKIAHDFNSIQSIYGPRFNYDAVVGIAARGDFDRADKELNALPATISFGSNNIEVISIYRRMIGLMRQEVATNSDPAFLYSVANQRHLEAYLPQPIESGAGPLNELDFDNLNSRSKIIILRREALRLNQLAEPTMSRRRFQEASDLIEGSSDAFIAQTEYRDLAWAMGSAGFTDLSRQTFKKAIAIVDRGDQALEKGMRNSLKIRADNQASLGISMTDVAFSAIAEAQAASGQLDDALKTHARIKGESILNDSTRGIIKGLAEHGDWKQSIQLLHELREKGGIVVSEWRYIISSQLAAGDIQDAISTLDETHGSDKIAGAYQIAYKWAQSDSIAALKWVHGQDDNILMISGLVGVTEQVLGIVRQK